MNPMNPACSFDRALPRAVALVRRAFPGIDLGGYRFIRDMNGRLFVVVPDAIAEEQLVVPRVDLARALGAYSPGAEGGLVRFEDTLSGPALLDEPSLRRIIDDCTVQVIERRVVGQDWAQAPEAMTVHPPRVAFFSLKGGVGRSTALFLWGRYLAAKGRTVLLIDLDLEAPGLGAQLLPERERPEYGVVDWLVEDLVGGPVADTMVTSLEAGMVAQASLSGASGLYVVPATGHATNGSPEEFIAKLARAYLEQGEPGMECGFASRVRRLCTALEGHVRPDVVLIDSRAGLHETAAAAILHLDADVLLFATDQPTVWEGYHYLLAQLGPMAGMSPTADGEDWRLRLKMVRALAGEAQSDFDRYLGRSYQLWLDCLYDESPPGASDERFSFDQNDDAGPHYPLTILRDARFENFNPHEQMHEVGEQAISAAFGGFCEALEQRIFGDGESDGA